VKLRSKPSLVAAAVAVLLALFLIRPGASRLKARIANSIGAALARQVEIGAVHLRLLPQPGFDLEGFVVHDDPSFSAEPVLRAQDVTALLRLTSLLHGHLAISRLSLTEPSLNLVRRSDGRWNIQSFLEGKAVVPLAEPPSNHATAGFPYIEADHGRINFKFGSEKKPFALTDASYAFWQDSENSWGMRLKGVPVRTDVNLSDTGKISLSGNWARGASLDQTPLHVSLRWDDTQLGQLSKALTGEDRGWRGTVNVSVNGTGTPAKLALQAEGSLRDFRRYDISENAPVELRSQCKAVFDARERSLRQVSCQVPLGDRAVEIAGEIGHLSGPRNYDLQVTADRLAMASLLAVVRHAKKDIPKDLEASGTLEANFALRSTDAGKLVWSGRGQTSDFHLKSAASKTDLAFDGIPFSWVPEAKRPEGWLRSRTTSGVKEPETPHMSIGPFALKLGRPVGVSVQGWVARQGYSFALKGEGEIQRLLEAARMTGIPSHPAAARGSAKLDLQIAGVWKGFAGPVATGGGELHQVEASLRNAGAPLEIVTAKLTLTPTETEVSSLTALVAGAHWNGSLKVPRACASVDACQTQFELHADVLSTESLNEWLNPRAPDRPWYELSAGRPESPSPLAGMRAAGTVSVERYLIRNFQAAKVTAKVELNRGRLHVSELRAGVLGGKHTGEWTADFTVKPPAYAGKGTLDGISLPQLAELMHDPWISGTAKGQYELQLAGWSSAELWNSAKGTMHFEARDGELPHITIGSTPLLMRHFSGVVAIEHGEIDLQHATLVAPEASYNVSGKASLARELDFTFSRQDAPVFRVAGTLAEPTVSSVRKSETRAALKP
jgi:hypothetical protein